MRSVQITVDVLLSDEVAEWVEEALGAMTFSSDLAYYLEQRHSGGYIVTQEKLASLVDDVVTNIDDYEDDDDDTEDSIEEKPIDAKSVEAIMRKVLTEVISDKAINIAGDLHAMSVADNNNQDEDNEEDITESDSIETFGLSGQSGDSEDISDDDLDDLADMFGF